MLAFVSEKYKFKSFSLEKMPLLTAYRYLHTQKNSNWLFELVFCMVRITGLVNVAEPYLPSVSRLHSWFKENKQLFSGR